MDTFGLIAISHETVVHGFTSSSDGSVLLLLLLSLLQVLDEVVVLFLNSQLLHCCHSLLAFLLYGK
jgi:hypothetical protein